MDYTVFLTQHTDTHWEATIPELPNCIVAAATRAEALANIQHRALSVFRHSEVLRVHIPSEPLTLERLGFGAFKNDSTFEALFDGIEQQRDAQPIGA